MFVCGRSFFFLLAFLGIEYWREKKKKVYNERFIQNMWWTKALKKWTKVLITILGLHFFGDICGKCGRGCSTCGFYLEASLCYEISYQPNDEHSAISFMSKTNFGLWSLRSSATLVMATKFNLSRIANSFLMLITTTIIWLAI